MIWRVLAFLLAISLIVLNYLELVKKITRYTITAILITLVIYLFLRITHL